MGDYLRFAVGGRDRARFPVFERAACYPHAVARLHGALGEECVLAQDDGAGRILHGERAADRVAWISHCRRDVEVCADAPLFERGVELRRAADDMVRRGGDAL